MHELIQVAVLVQRLLVRAENGSAQAARANRTRAR